MKFELSEARDLLARTPATLQTWLRDLPESWAHQNEGPETWSPYDVLGHLIHGERTDWIPRACILLDQGASTTFEPFDRFAQFATGTEESLNDRLDLFTELRSESLTALDGMQLKPALLQLEGRHPEFGLVTLEQLLATWVVHDLGHVAQIARVLAKNHTEEVGPWAAYIPVLGKTKP